MFPRFYPYGQPNSVPNINNLLGLGLSVDPNSLAQAQNLSNALIAGQPNLFNAAAIQQNFANQFAVLQPNQILAGFPITNPVNPLVSIQLSLSQLNLPYLNGPAQSQVNLPQPLEVPNNSASITDSHTIVRAPVLYGNAVSQVWVHLMSSENFNWFPYLHRVHARFSLFVRYKYAITAQ